MKKIYNLILLVLILILVGFIFFSPSYGWKLRSYFAPDFYGGVDNNDLVLENAILKAELAKLEAVKTEIPENRAGYFRAMVFSRYPMNFKNEILVDIGKNSGVVDGRGVLYGGVLIGKIFKVFDEAASVQTVFDNRFQTSVKVGPFGAEALFKGGVLPKVILIPKKAVVKSGDAIYSVSPDYPYGLAIGEINDIEFSGDQLFKEATVKFPYDPNVIETILISKK